MDPVISLSPMRAGEHAMAGMAMGATSHSWAIARFGITFFMWWVMMIAMMLPSAAPTILLYARAALSDRSVSRPATESFLIGYLLIWGGFSLIATLVQLLLEQSGLLARMQMVLTSRILSSGILIAAGIYQLSPLKEACLRHCRSPAHFLSRYYKAGTRGAIRMGVMHGSYCVGCCWLLMALLFVGGVMNLMWIALLTLLVAAEKLLPFGRRFAIFAGLCCIVGGAVVLGV
ncbi:MAG: DUF2182 domain-containing protein [Thermomicrobiales bacterium]